MPRYLLDTNIASFLVKRSNAALDDHIRHVEPEDICISAVTEAEIRFGLALLPSEAHMQVLMREFLRNTIILAWDSLCAHQYARIAAMQRYAGDNVDAPDLMIAAHAFACDLTLISNDAVFQLIHGLKLEDWSRRPQPQ